MFATAAKVEMDGEYWTVRTGAREAAAAAAKLLALGSDARTSSGAATRRLSPFIVIVSQVQTGPRPRHAASRVGMALIILLWCSGAGWLRPSPVACRSQPVARMPASLDTIVTQSLDRHAQRLQYVLPGEPARPERRRLQLQTAEPEDWRLVIDALAPFIREKRVRSMQRALVQRRSGLHLVVENIGDPHNAQTVCRTAEGLGIQHLHVIESVTPFQLPAAAALATSRSPLGRDDNGEGAGRWLSIHRHASAEAAVAALRERRLRLLVSDCPTDEESGAAAGGGGVEADSGEAGGGEGGESEGGSGYGGAHEGMSWVVASRSAGRAVRIDKLAFSDCFSQGGRGAALIFGNERRGVSRVLSEAADEAFYLPMGGFTQSFNVGVAAGMSLSAAVATGCFPTGTLCEDEQAECLGRWLLRDIKAARGLLAQAGLEFDDF